MPDPDLDEQLAYYRARAPEYDQWHRREGRYDRGPEHRARWFAALDDVRTALVDARPYGDALELACGTGLWTPTLAAGATRLTAVDAAPETIAVNRARLGDAPVRFLVADLFAWEPDRTYDFVFFGFWLSHVPPARFDAFWGLVRRALRPGGRAFLVDSLLHQGSLARDHVPPDGSGTVERRLNDGRSYRIVKVFHEPAALQRRLADLGFAGEVRTSGEFFLHGCLTRQASAPPRTGRRF